MPIPTSWLTEIVALCAPSSSAAMLVAGARIVRVTAAQPTPPLGVWSRLCEIARRWSHGERERFLARAFDPCDLERRERAWEQDQIRNGSLLGRD